LSKFEKEVRKALLEKDMRLTDLAKFLGITLPYLYDIFKGNRPGLTQKKRIIDFLDLGESVLD